LLFKSRIKEQKHAERAEIEKKEKARKPPNLLSAGEVEEVVAFPIVAAPRDQEKKAKPKAKREK